MPYFTVPGSSPEVKIHYLIHEPVGSPSTSASGSSSGAEPDSGSISGSSSSSIHHVPSSSNNDDNNNNHNTTEQGHARERGQEEEKQVKLKSPSNIHHPTAVLIHGWTCSLHNFTFQIPYLTGLGYRVITPELRGHGGSPIPQYARGQARENGKDDKDKPDTNDDDDDDDLLLNGDYSIQTNAADILALLDHLGYTGSTASTSVLLVGHSAGCAIASLMAVANPHLARGLILFDPAYVVPKSVCDVMISIINRASIRAGTSTTLLIDNFFNTEGFFPPSTPGWLRAWILNTTASTRPVVTQRFLEMGWGSESENESETGETGAGAGAGARARALGQWENFCKWAGENDRNGKCKVRLAFYANEMTAEAERGLGMKDGDEVVVMEDGGHWLHMHKPDVVNEKIGLWLKAVNLLPSPSEL